MQLLAPLKAFAICLVNVVVAIAAVTNVCAHPHVLVDAKAEIVFDEQGRINAVRNIWQFDEAFSAFAIQGLDQDDDGNLSDEELAPLAQENVESLAAYDFFTYLVAGERKHVFLPPKEYRDEFHDGRLTLTFTLPLDEPVAVNGTVKVEIFDPEYFVAITLVPDHPVRLDSAPSSCKATFQPPHELDASTITALAAIPIDQHDLPPDLLDAASALSNLIRISCSGLAQASAPAAHGEARSPSSAAGSSPSISGAEAAANQTSTSAATSTSHLGPAVVVGVSLTLLVGLVVCSVLLWRSLRGANRQS